MTNIRFYLSLILILHLGAGLAVSEDDRGFAHLVPNETLLYGEVRDFSDLQDGFNQGGFEKLRNDADFKKFIAPLMKNIELPFIESDEDEADDPKLPSMVEVKRTFTGGGCWFLSELIFGGASDTSPGYRERNSGFMLEFEGDREQVRGWIEHGVIGIDRLEGEAVRKTEMYEGVEIFTTVFRKKIFAIPEGVETPDAVDGDTTLPDPLEIGTAEYHYEYAFVDNLCIVLEGQRAFMKKVLSNYFATRDGGAAPDTSMAATEEFRLAIEPMGERPDVMGYVNIGRLFGKYREAGNLVQFDALNLKEVRSAGLGFRILPDQAVTDAVLVAQPDPQGIASLLLTDMENRFETQNIVPTDAVSYSSIWLDMEKVYDLLVRPLLGDPTIQAIESAFEQQAGFSLRDGLLNPLQGEVGMYMREGPDGETRESQLLMLRDAQGYAESLAVMLRFFYGGLTQAMNLSPTDYMGYPVYTWTFRDDFDQSKLPQGFKPPTTAFAVVGNCLVVSDNVEEVRYVLKSIVEGTAGLRGNASYGRAVSELPRDYIWVGWSNLSALPASVFDDLKDDGMAQAVFSEILDMKSAPSIEKLQSYFSTNYTALYSRMGRAHYTMHLQWPVE